MAWPRVRKSLGLVRVPREALPQAGQGEDLAPCAPLSLGLAETGRCLHLAGWPGSHKARHQNNSQMNERVRAPSELSTVSTHVPSRCSLAE